MKIIEEWSYPLEYTKEQIESDVDRTQSIGYCKVVDAVLVEKTGIQTNNNYIKSESVIKQ